jgi:hypothetical protein
MIKHIQIAKVLHKVNGKYEKVRSFQSLNEDELNDLIIKTANGFVYKLVQMESSD